MIKAIELYLVTENNGKEALAFYQDVFQAKLLTCTTYGQAMPHVPDNQKDLILNAALDIQGIRLQLSDNGYEHAYAQGTQMTACIQVSDAEKAKNIYEKLSVNAKHISLPLQETPWSPAYAMLVDQFGMHWQINTDIPGFVSENVKF